MAVAKLDWQSLDVVHLFFGNGQLLVEIGVLVEVTHMEVPSHYWPLRFMEETPLKDPSKVFHP
jgi:hypothetical protein